MSERGPRYETALAAVIAATVVMAGATQMANAQPAAGANDPVAVPGQVTPADRDADRDAGAATDTSPQDRAQPAGDGASPPAGDEPAARRLPEYRQGQLPLGPRAEASADRGDAGAGGGGGSGGGMGWWGLQTVMALAVVIGLILLLRAWLRRMSGASATPTARGLVEVLGRTTVGPKTQVLFLRVNERVIVAGQTPAGIQTLTCIDEPEEVASLLAQAEADRPQSISQGFGKLLKQFERDGGVGVAASAVDRGDAGVVDRARGELNGLLGRLKHMRGEGSRQEEREVR